MAMKALPLVLLVLFVALADGARDIWADYEHAPTTCEVSNCATGGCLFEDCDRPLSCSGGLCYFRNCKEATCEGGACVFERVEDVKCPGGACQFRNMHRTLSEGYCTGGGCRLDGEAHPTDFAATLSE